MFVDYTAVHEHHIIPNMEVVIVILDDYAPTDTNSLQTSKWIKQIVMKKRVHMNLQYQKVYMTEK